jgi:hypothetical protein
MYNVNMNKDILRYKIKQARNEHNSYLDFITNQLIPSIDNTLCVRYYVSEHYAERLVERNIDRFFMLRIISYIIEHKLQDVLEQNSIAIVYRNEMTLILNIIKKEGRFQKEFTIRLDTVFNGLGGHVDKKYFVSFEDMMRYEFPRFRNGYKSSMNFDIKIKKSIENLHSFVDSL